MKISNHNNLRQLALSELHKHFDKIEKKGFVGSFKFKWVGASQLFEGTVDYTITVKLSENRKDNRGGYVKSTGYDKRMVWINSFFVRNRMDVISILVHEITHISQETNEAFNDSDYNHRRLHEMSGTKLTYNQWYASSSGHHLNAAEHECRLAELFQHMLEGADVLKFANNHGRYFHFTNEEYMEKGLEYGVSEAALLLLTKQVEADLTANYNSDRRFHYGWMLEEYRLSLPMFKMLNIDHSYYALLEVSMKAAIERANTTIWVSQADIELTKKILAEVGCAA